MKKQEFEAITRSWCEGDLYNEQSSMDYNTLPKAIQDCIRIAKSLGWVKYKACNKFMLVYDTYHPSDNVDQDKSLITGLFKAEW